MSILVLRPAADEQLDLGMTLEWRHGGRGGEGGVFASVGLWVQQTMTKQERSPLTHLC